MSFTAKPDPRPLLAVLSEPDPVAARVGSVWGAGEATGEHVDGAAIRSLGEGLWAVRRPGHHIHDERLDERLPSPWRERRPTLVFPSVHRSESGQHCFTVHPLGNPGESAELGGRPRTLVPTDPRAMAAILRRLAEEAPRLASRACYEATHHGPELAVPACFVEVAVLEGAAPTPEEAKVVAAAIRGLAREPTDRVALAVGGGHYAPRFTDLALDRRWAFGHILSRHALEDLDAATARSALAFTEGSEGFVLARAQDRVHPALEGLGAELKETAAARREPVRAG